jgi:hypothetical protein
MIIPSLLANPFETSNSSLYEVGSIVFNRFSTFSISLAAAEGFKNKLLTLFRVNTF